MRHLWITTTGIATMAMQSAPPPASAQDEQSSLQPDGGQLIIDLTQARRDPEADPIAAQECEEEADAARIAGEIVVCRSLGESTDGAWNQEDFNRRYAEVTQGVKAPNVEVDPTPPMVGITLRAKFGAPSPPALIINVEALPEAPPGSDADRIARGLAPNAIR